MLILVVKRDLFLVKGTFQFLHPSDRLRHVVEAIDYSAKSQQRSVEAVVEAIGRTATSIERSEMTV